MYICKHIYGEREVHAQIACHELPDHRIAWVCVSMCVCMCVYLDIYTERERGTLARFCGTNSLTVELHECVSTCVCMCVFRYISREREKYTHKFSQHELSDHWIARDVSACVTVYMCMGWLRLVGSLKLKVSFAEYRLFYRDLWQKRPIIWRSLLIVATPYVNIFP